PSTAVVVQTRMSCAVALTPAHIAAAEEKLGAARVAHRPVAAAGCQLEQRLALGHRDLGVDDRFWLGRRGVGWGCGAGLVRLSLALGAVVRLPAPGGGFGAAWEIHPARLGAHHAALDAHLGGDLTGAQASIPERAQLLFLVGHPRGHAATVSTWCGFG